MHVCRSTRRSPCHTTLWCMTGCQLGWKSLAASFLIFCVPPGQLLLAGAYYLLVRRPPSAARQAVLGGLRDASRESLLAASKMTRYLQKFPSTALLLLMLTQVLRPSAALPTVQANPGRVTDPNPCKANVTAHAMPRLEADHARHTANGRQVEVAQLQKHAPADVAAAFAAVLADDGCLPPTHPAAYNGGGGDAGEQLRLEARKLVAGLRAAAPTLPCAWDASLPADPGQCVSGSADTLLLHVCNCAACRWNEPAGGVRSAVTGCFQL